MRAKNVTVSQMKTALINLNDDYNGNIIFNRFEQKKNYIHFTLKVKSSKELGHRLGVSGKRLACACWHAHGDFFDELFAIIPDAVIYSGQDKITKDYGNWEDRNIGSIMNPVMFSEACECK